MWFPNLLTGDLNLLSYAFKRRKGSSIVFYANYFKSNVTCKYFAANGDYTPWYFQLTPITKSAKGNHSCMLKLLVPRRINMLFANFKLINKLILLRCQ